LPHCNLKLTKEGKLVQVKAIKAGDALTFDYGVEWWARRVTGVTWKEWMNCSIPCAKGRMELFGRMHEQVHDYTELLNMRQALLLQASRSELEKERVGSELWEYLERNTT
jgi:hypothetical protein